MASPEKTVDQPDPQGVEDVEIAEVSSTPPDVRLSARRLVEDVLYQKNLLIRLRSGIAGPVEPVLWKYAYGDPKIHHKVQSEEQRFKRLREAMKNLRLQNPEAAKLLDLQAQSVTAVDAEVDTPEESDE